MRELDQGDTFVVTRNGVPVGELTLSVATRFVVAEALTAIFASAPPSDDTRTDLDAVANQDLAPRG